MWSFQRAYARRGSSSPRSQPGLIRRLPSSTNEYLAGVRTLSDLKKTEDVPPHFALPVLAIQSGGLVLDASHGPMRGIEHCVGRKRVLHRVLYPPHAAHPDEYHDLELRIGANNYQRARTPVITISQLSTISPASLLNE